jgi:hypothetical protein
MKCTLTSIYVPKGAKSRFQRWTRCPLALTCLWNFRRAILNFPSIMLSATRSKYGFKVKTGVTLARFNG